ncbi:MAG: type II toxin-antitoxin system VapC family toxin [Proteobacteria bacterium]|nr:type II toxin-antitoxin system VapC family toxin [Pseudomonadota bacterium]MBU1388647.1 type II toxin-antitoxin system VapC family toxin [Pseudomonadota bacterium]MBU1544884.1 type II toxin-antitoxin system VapC family toxin [Pseudomonadota bacterium]MBU2429342.1 type II toxin-antitoxin system VapC family toxin [Pseudomonadota bacterium]MBU2479470.1 type II toxin-antitoxin system VapC family toxin [Pseudomonadota bacterium]
MIVVDTNVISYFYLNSEYSELAEELFLKTSQWSAPLLWRSEFRNVLSFYIRKEIVSISDAFQIFEAAQTLMNGAEYEVNALKVLRLSYESGCSAYDCEFVNLAQDLNVPLVTMDKKILRNFPDWAVSIPEYLKHY